MDEKKYKRNILLILATVFLGFLIWSSVQFQEFFAKIVPIFENIAHRDPILSIFVFLGLGVLSTMLSSFSSVPLVPIAVILWGDTGTALLLFAGWLTGDVIAYSIGYWAGHPLLARFAPMERIEYYRKKIPPDAELKLVFAFIMSMPSEIPNYTLGTLRYSFIRYFSIIALGELIFAFLTAYAGSALVAKQFALFVGAVALLVLFFGYFFYLFNKYLREK